MKSGRLKRGVAARRLAVLDELRAILRSELTAERMLKAVAAHLAAGGDYCIADMVDESGVLRRLEISHADPSRRERLRIAAEDTRHHPQGRVAALLNTGGAEVVPRVSRAAWARSYSDIVLLHGEAFGSYMAASISVSGTPMAVLTIVTSTPERRLGADDLSFLRVIGEWTALGLENALRRELQPRTSVVPPPPVEPREQPELRRARRA